MAGGDRHPLPREWQSVAADLPSIDRHEAARIIRKVEGDLIQIDRKFIGLGGITMVQMHSPFLLKAYGVAKVTELDPVEIGPYFPTVEAT